MTTLGPNMMNMGFLLLTNTSHDQCAGASNRPSKTYYLSKDVVSYLDFTSKTKNDIDKDKDNGNIASTKASS